MQQYTSMGRCMTIIVKHFKAFLRTCLSEYDLNAADGMVLMMLYHKAAREAGKENSPAGSTQEEIIKEIHYDKGVMTRTMKELEDKGYVVRSQHPTDNRSFIFSLTEKGKNFEPVMMDILQQWNQKMIAGNSEEDLKIVEATLLHMAENVSK